MKKLILLICFMILYTLIPVVLAEEADLEKQTFDKPSTLNNPQTTHKDLEQPNFKTRTGLTIPGLDFKLQQTNIPLNMTYYQSDLINGQLGVDARAFFVGGVARSYDEKKSSVTQTVNLNNYIKEGQKVIRSITDEVFWDYGNGYITVNTPKSQGATGFLSKLRRIDLDDIRIIMRNDYGTVLAISLDGLSIKESKKILIQAATEETSFGWREEAEFDSDGNDTGVRKITNIGASPLNVRKIDTTVEFFKLSGEIARISALDEHGYMKKQLAWKNTETGGVIINLPEDSLYTVIEIDEMNEKVSAKMSQGLVAGIDYIWLEGEEASYSYKFTNMEFQTYEFPETAHLLSGGSWQTSGGDWNDEDTIDPPISKWEFEILDDGGTYYFYARKFWHWGPFDYRAYKIGDDPDTAVWHSVPDDITFMDSTSLKTFVGVNWFSNGEIELNGGGKYILELKQRSRTSTPGKAWGLDCIVLTRKAFMPNGHLRPGQKLGNVNDSSWWAFEPEYDDFTADALLDMRHLMNEEEAGETGYIYMENGRFYYPNGEPMNFWATNITVDNVLKGSRASAEYFVEQSAKFGVNLVRVHGSVFDGNGNILPDMLDAYQHFIMTCKKAGVYVKASHYYAQWNNMHLNETFKFQGDGPDGLIGFLEFQREGFGFRLWNKQMQGLQRMEFEKLLTSPNPYGVPILNDPTLAIIELENEDSLFFFTFADWRIPDDQRIIWKKMFGDWLANKYGSLKKAQQAWGQGSSARWASIADNFERGLVDIPSASAFDLRWIDSREVYNRAVDTREFGMTIQKDYYDSQIDYIRNDLGWRGMFIAGNWTTGDNQIFDSIERWTYNGGDIIDRHAYNNVVVKPKTQQAWAVNNGDTYIDKSVLVDPLMAPIVAVQTIGKAHCISEIAWESPTRYSAEAPLMQAAYGALQGQDIVFYFQSMPNWESGMTGKWPANIPTIRGQWPGFSLMFRRGDVAEAQIVALENVTMSNMLGNHGNKIFNGSMIDSLRANSGN